jgi:putative membrane protein
LNEATASEPAGRSRDEEPRSPVDVRQQLAADRTLLAWIRTAVALAALGFVVAKFNLFLREVEHVSATSSESARALGVSLTATAAIVLFIGVVQHRRITTLLARHGDPLDADRWPAVVGAALALLAIVAVAVYLATGVR